MDLGFRGTDAGNLGREIIHRGKFKSLSKPQKDGLKGSIDDAWHSISCAAGYNLRWLLRTVACLGAGAVFASVASSAVTAAGRRDVIRCVGRVWTATMRNRIANVVVKKMIFGHAVQGAFLKSEFLQG